MHEIGPQLRAAREAREISLEQAEEETKIRKKYLEALENDTPDVIPGDVYVRGFLRSYANWLGLDGTELVEQHKERQSGAPAKGAAPVEPGDAADEGAQVHASTVKGPSATRAPRALAMPTLPRKERHKPGPSGLSLLLACGVVAVAIAGYLIIRGMGNQPAAPPPTQAPAPQQGAGSGTNTAAPPTTAGTTVTGNPASTEAPAAKVTMNKPKGEAVLFDVNGSGPIDVALEFDSKASVYMKVTVDGKVVAEQSTTDPATTHWTGKTVTIRLGHAETLKAIKVNGQTFAKPLTGGPFTLTFAPHA